MANVFPFWGSLLKRDRANPQVLTGVPRKQDTHLCFGAAILYWTLIVIFAQIRTSTLVSPSPLGRTDTNKSF